jgi:hypothetical protein
MRTVNLDEYRIAAAEDGNPTVVFGGKTYELPAELPISIVVAIRGEDIEGAVRGLFGAAAADVLNAGLSVQDLDRIAKNCYGLSSGESQASAGSPKTGGATSRRKSNTGTKLTPVPSELDAS